MKPFPIWCDMCAKQNECHIADTVPKCYEPKQTEPRRKTTEYCDICNHEKCENCVADSRDDYCVPSNFEQTEPSTEATTGLPGPCIGCLKECEGCDFQKAKEAWEKTQSEMPEFAPWKDAYDKMDCGWK